MASSIPRQRPPNAPPRMCQLRAATRRRPPLSPEGPGPGPARANAMLTLQGADKLNAAANTAYSGGRKAIAWMRGIAWVSLGGLLDTSTISVVIFVAATLPAATVTIATLIPPGGARTYLHCACTPATVWVVFVIDGTPARAVRPTAVRRTVCSAEGSGWMTDSVLSRVRTRTSCVSSAHRADDRPCYSSEDSCRRSPQDGPSIYPPGERFRTSLH